VDEREYAFEPDNPFLTVADPMAEGLRLVSTGNLSDAALGTHTERLVAHTYARTNTHTQAHTGTRACSCMCVGSAFEAAVRQDEHAAAAWLQLGLCQAENEKELAAIAALQRAVREDPLAADASLVRRALLSTHRQWLCAWAPRLAPRASRPTDAEVDARAVHP
jgi:hypothetical protein